VLLAGRVATQEAYGELFTNAKEDIKRAKILAEQIIEEFGMSEEYFSSHIHVERLLHDATMEVKSLLSQLNHAVERVRDYLLKKWKTQLPPQRKGPKKRGIKIWNWKELIF